MDVQVLEQIARSSGKAFFIFHPNSLKFDFLNPAAGRLFEMSLEQIISSPENLLSVIHPADLDLLQVQFRNLTALLRQAEVTFRITLPLDRIRHLKAEVFAIKNASGETYALAGMVEDVSAQAQQIAYLKEFGHKKNSALEIVAHDLRGPLSIVKNISALLEADAQQEIYDELGTYTQLIQRAYEDCSNLIQSVLEDEHLKSPTVQIKRERIDAVAKVLAVVDNYRLAPSIEVPIKVVAHPPVLEAELDEVKFMQIINNLISNSVKFTPPDGQITIYLEEDEHTLRIMHQDNGIGIPAALQPFIFERYSRASRPGLRQEKSSGIGLAIVRDLVEIHGGKIWFESLENQGTTFFLTFPK